MMLFGIGIQDPKRLLPFAQFLIAILIHLIVYISFYHFCSPDVPVPKYLVDSPMIDTFSDEGLKFVEVMSATVGCVLIADIIIEMSLYYWGTSKFGTRKNKAGGGARWPSDLFLDRAKEWCVRLLVIISIVIPPIVLLNVRMDEYFVVYAMGMRVIRYHSLAAATWFVVCDTLDRSWLQFASTTSINLLYGVFELTYSFLTLREQSSTTTTVLSIVKPLRLVLYSITGIRVFYHYFVLFRSLCNANSELRLRRLTVKDWKFLAYSSMFLVSFGVFIGAASPKNFTYYMLTPNELIPQQIFFTILAVISTLLPLAVSRYEVARAENVTYYAEQKVMRALNDPLREAVAELDKLIEREQETSSDVHNNSRLQSLLKIALACHATVDILEEDVNRLERDDDANANSNSGSGSMSGGNGRRVVLESTSGCNGALANDDSRDIVAGAASRCIKQDDSRVDVDLNDGSGRRHHPPLPPAPRSSNNAVAVYSKSISHNRSKKHTFTQRHLHRHPYLLQRQDYERSHPLGNNNSDNNHLLSGRNYDTYNRHNLEETATLRSKKSKLSSISNMLSSITEEKSVEEAVNIGEIDADMELDAMISRVFDGGRFCGPQFINDKSAPAQVYSPLLFENNRATSVELYEKRDDDEGSCTVDLVGGVNDPSATMCLDHVTPDSGNVDQYFSDNKADCDNKSDASGAIIKSTSEISGERFCFSFRKSASNPNINQLGTMKGHDFQSYRLTSLPTLAPAVSSVLSVSTVSKSALQSDNFIIPQGIGCYCFGNYMAAGEALLMEIEVSEGTRLHTNSREDIWPSDLRLWLCAALNKLQKYDKVQIILDHPAKIRALEALIALSGTGTGSSATRGSNPVVRQHLFIGVFMSFYAGECSVNEVVEFVERVSLTESAGGAKEEEEDNGEDRYGFKFFGYFYLGLYYESMGDYNTSAPLLLQAMKLRVVEDMWHTVALVLSRHS